MHIFLQWSCSISSWVRPSHNIITLKLFPFVIVLYNVVYCLNVCLVLKKENLVTIILVYIYLPTNRHIYPYIYLPSRLFYLYIYPASWHVHCTSVYLSSYLTCPSVHISIQLPGVSLCPFSYLDTFNIFFQEILKMEEKSCLDTIHTQTHTITLLHTHIHTHIYSHTHTHIHTITLLHTHTYTNTYTGVFALSDYFSFLTQYSRSNLFRTT